MYGGRNPTTDGDSSGGATETTRRSFMRAAGAGAAGLALGGVAGTASVSAVPTPRLHTEGKWIVDPAGNPVKLRGFATASLDFIAFDWYPYTVREVLRRATDPERWHPNHIRLPCEWSGIQDHGGVEAFVDDILRPAVDYLAARNVYAMIDLHLIRPYTDEATAAVNEEEDEDLEPIDDVLEGFWSVVAPEFADDEHVLYELFNEPTYPQGQWPGDDAYSVGSREESWLLWRDQAQPWVDLIRSHAPETPVVIGSPNWTSETQFAPEHPFEGENLIYSSHIYPANGLPYEESEDNGTTLPPFDPEYGAPAEEVPVIVTEFGWDPDEQFSETVEYGTTSEWGEPFREWVEGYDNMGWTGWCFDDSWAPTFFESPAENPEQGAARPWALKDDPEEQGWYIRQWLEETKDDMVPEDPYGADEPPNPPTDLAVRHAGEILAEIAWEPATDPGEAGISHYEVFLEGEHQRLVLPSEGLEATLEGLDPDSRYEASVVAIDEAGTESEPATFVVETVPYGSAQSPYDGPNEVPAQIQAEDFDEGGRGVAYYDTSPGNAGGAYRPDESVDVEESDDGGHHVGYFEPGEWLEYTITVAESGTYDLSANLANGSDSHLDPAVSAMADRESVGETAVWPTNGWQSFQSFDIGSVELATGEHIVRLTAESGSCNVDWLELELAEAHDVDPEEPGEPEDPEEPPEVGGYRPQPHGDDGMYWDVDGTGTLGSNDVVVFFEHFEDPAIRNYPSYYDFNGSGSVGFDDVVALFRGI